MTESSHQIAGTSLQQSLASYLARLGRLDEEPLGPRKRNPRPATPEDNAFLAASLRTAKKSQNRLFTICIAVLCVIFALQIGILIVSVLAKNRVGGAIGGGMLVFWPIVWWLRRLWMDSMILDLARDVLNELPPEQAVKMIEILYWGSLMSKGKRVERT